MTGKAGMKAIKSPATKPNKAVLILSEDVGGKCTRMLVSPESKSEETAIAGLSPGASRSISSSLSYFMVMRRLTGGSGCD
jgi:hypothetical protein